jgi:hypothetical protein
MIDIPIISNQAEFEKNLKECSDEKLNEFRKYIKWKTRKMNETELKNCDSLGIFYDEVEQKIEVACWIVQKKNSASENEIPLKTLKFFFKNIKKVKDYESYKKNPFKVPLHSDGKPLYDSRFIIKNCKKPKSSEQIDNDISENKYDGPLLQLIAPSPGLHFQDFMKPGFFKIRKEYLINETVKMPEDNYTSLYKRPATASHPIETEKNNQENGIIPPVAEIKRKKKRAKPEPVENPIPDPIPTQQEITNPNPVLIPIQKETINSFSIQNPSSTEITLITSTESGKQYYFFPYPKGWIIQEKN